jgi:hypothetical protein
MNQIIKQTKDEYFASTGLSNSFLSAFDYSPAHAFLPKEPTEAMDSGTMFHEYLLEPQVFAEKYLASNFTDKRTTDYKRLVSIYPDKIIISNDEIANLEKANCNLSKTIFDFQTMAEIFENVQFEISCFSDMLGFQCKGLFDILYEKNKNYVIFDLKKCQDALNFHKSIITYKYYRQAAWYMSLLSAHGIPREKIRFIFIAVEEQSPNGVILYELSPDYINYGDCCNILSVENYSKWLNRGADKSELYKETFKVIEKPGFLF